MVILYFLILSLVPCQKSTITKSNTSPSTGSLVPHLKVVPVHHMVLPHLLFLSQCTMNLELNVLKLRESFP